MRSYMYCLSIRIGRKNKENFPSASNCIRKENSNDRTNPARCDPAT